MTAAIITSTKCNPHMTIIYAFSGVFAGGIPTNLPLVFRESFPNDYDSSLGIANIGRGIAAVAFGASFGQYVLYCISQSDLERIFLQLKYSTIISPFL